MAKYLDQEGLINVITQLKKYTDDSIPINVSELTNDSNYAKISDIPTDEHINNLINTALGVIENGSY